MFVFVFAGKIDGWGLCKKDIVVSVRVWVCVMEGIGGVDGGGRSVGVSGGG